MSNREARRGVRQPSLCFVNVVWGASFTRAFLDVCVPTQLSPGNLEYCGREHDSVYVLYTTRADAALIRESTAIKRLEAVLSLEIRFIEDVVSSSAIGRNKHLAMTACHAHAIRVAERDCAFIFLAPDTVWADGSFRHIAALAERGKRLVVMAGLRLAKESFINEFLPLYGGDGVARPISPRDLVRIGTRHLHPDTRSLLWDGPSSNNSPSILLWQAASEGLLVRAFHLHPILVHPVRRDILPTVTIDDDYVMTACPSSADMHVVDDSDDVLTFEFSSHESRWEGILPWPQNPYRVAHWAHFKTNERHRELISRPIRIHSTTCGPEWSEVEDRSAAVVRQISDLVDDPMGGENQVKPTLSVLFGHPTGIQPDPSLLSLIGIEDNAFDAIQFVPMEAIEDTTNLAGKRKKHTVRCRDRSALVDSNRLAAVESDYVLPIAAGDALSPQFVDRGLRLLARYPDAGILFSDSQWFEQARNKCDYADFFSSTDSSFLSPEELVRLLRDGCIPGPPTVLRRPALVRLPSEITNLGPYAYWFAWLTLAFRHGACYLRPDVHHTSIVPVLPRAADVPTVRRETAAREIVEILKTSAFSDVLPFFIASRALTALGEDVVQAALRFAPPDDAIAHALATPPVAKPQWDSVRVWWSRQRLTASRSSVWYKRSLLIRATVGPFYGLARYFLKKAKTAGGPRVYFQDRSLETKEPGQGRRPMFGRLAKVTLWVFVTTAIAGVTVLAYDARLWRRALAGPGGDGLRNMHTRDARPFEQMVWYPYTGAHIKGNAFYRGVIPLESQEFYKEMEYRAGDHGFFVDIDLEKPPLKEKNEFRIIMTGGSAAQGWGAEYIDEMVYRSLEKTLNDRLAQDGYRVRVINLAMAGSISYQNFIALNLWAHALDPDLILTYSGGNDLLVPQVTRSDAPMAWDVIQAYITSMHVQNMGPWSRRVERWLPGLFHTTRLGGMLRFSEMNQTSAIVVQEYTKHRNFEAAPHEIATRTYVHALRSIQRDFPTARMLVAFQPIDFRMIPDTQQMAPEYAEFRKRTILETQGTVRDDWIYVDLMAYWDANNLWATGKLGNGLHLPTIFQNVVRDQLAVVIEPVVRERVGRRLNSRKMTRATN